mgnify:FL=1
MKDMSKTVKVSSAFIFIALCCEIFISHASALPSVSSIAPASGLNNANITVTITGTGFY